MKRAALNFLFILIGLISTESLLAQGGINWGKDGQSYYRNENGEIVRYVLPENKKEVLVMKDKLKTAGAEKPIPIRSFKFSADYTQVLI